MSMTAKNSPEGTGQVGTLNEEQIAALKKLWAAIYEIQEKGTVTVVAEPAPVAEITPEPVVPVAASTGWGGGWFGSAAATTPAAPVEPVVEPPVTLTLEELGLTGEDLHAALWNNVMCDHPDSFVLRFLRARKWHVGNGLTMILKAFQWRKEQSVEDVKTLSDDELEEKYPKFKNQLEMGKFYVHGVDNQGQPVVYLNVGLHRPADQEYRTLERLTLYLMESGRLLIQPPVGTVALIFDLSQFGLANMDYNLVKFLVQCFEAYYPESLGAILIHKSPFVFWGVWKIIEPWLDPVVASKIVFTSTDADLLKYIPAEHLPASYEGGKDKFTYKYLAPVEGENDRMKDVATKEKLQGEWDSLAQQFEGKTKAWIVSEEGEKDRIGQDRSEIAKNLRSQYYKLQPYIRARSQFHRKDENGVSILQEDGSAIWTYEN
ncbi:hypothetical protein BG004_001456 [Podila humilis]|nr:hypothetical protein BG004_001456 [Podila humilis]